MVNKKVQLRECLVEIARGRCQYNSPAVAPSFLWVDMEEEIRRLSEEMNKLTAMYIVLATKYKQLLEDVENGRYAKYKCSCSSPCE